MLDTTKPLAFFDADENLLALIDPSADQLVERSYGKWAPFVGSSDDLDGAEVVSMDPKVVDVLDEADKKDQELTRADLEQYMIPMDLGSE